jgi:hypothetical protein
MEREGQRSSGEPSQTAEEEQSCMLEKKKVIMAVTQMLDSGTLDEKSLRLLEQLADCIHCPLAEMAREAEPDKQAAAQQATPARGEPVQIEPSGAPKVEPSPGGDSKCPAGKKVIVGSCAPRQRSDGHARCHRAPEDSTASRIAGFSTRWSRRTGSSW